MQPTGAVTDAKQALCLPLFRLRKGDSRMFCCSPAQHKLCCAALRCATLRPLVQPFLRRDDLGSDTHAALPGRPSWAVHLFLRGVPGWVLGVRDPGRKAQGQESRHGQVRSTVATLSTVPRRSVPSNSTRAPGMYSQGRRS